jgi:hypothetical protein
VIELDLFAGGVPGGERRFTITKAFLGGDPVTDLRSATDHFAAGDFLELTDDEKIHRPSFEAMPAGVNLLPKAIGFGGQAPGTANQAADSEIDFEEIVIDPDGNLVRKEQPSPLSTVLGSTRSRSGPRRSRSCGTAGRRSSRGRPPGSRWGRSSSRSRASPTSPRSR